MQVEDFLEKARKQISDDPISRLTFLAKSKLEQPDCVIDIHTHIFDKKCLSIGYILLRMLNALTMEAFGFEALDEASKEMELLTKSEDEVYADIEAVEVDSDATWSQLEKELEKTIELNETYELFGYNLKEAYQVLKKKDMLEVLDYYENEFAITNLPEHVNDKLVTGVLQMDLETGWNFKPKRNFKEQIEDLKKITRKRAILPYLALDPRRADALGKDENLYELFLNVFTDKETPFFGVKCYPALGYLPSDVRLDPIFQICAEKNIPVLTHCGGETVSTFKKTISVKNANGYKDYKIPGDSRKLRARFLNEPYHWDPVLHKHNKLKLNFGHFGGDDSWEELRKTGSNKRIEKIIDMMRTPNWRVYGDFSWNVIEDEHFDIFRSTLDANPDIAARTLYGTDFWVVLPSGELMKMQEKFLNKMGPHKSTMLKDNTLAYLLK